VSRDTVAHVVEKEADPRERYAPLVITTLERPWEVWLTEYTDGTLRPQYIGLFAGKRNLLVVVRENRDGALMWNVMHSDDRRMSPHRVGGCYGPGRGRCGGPVQSIRANAGPLPSPVGCRAQSTSRPAPELLSYANAMIEIKPDLGPVKAQLDRLAKAGADLSPLMRTIAGVLHDEIEENGSSPRARGTPLAAAPVLPLIRFIPARGEHTKAVSITAPINGSSPRARGTQERLHARLGRDRFIPARAGNTSTTSSWATKSSVHPRARGEHDAGTHIDPRYVGSSPRARGTRAHG